MDCESLRILLAQKHLCWLEAFLLIIIIYIYIYIYIYSSVYINEATKRQTLDCSGRASKFQSSATGRHYPIQQKLSCSSRNVIYLATCVKCNLQYVGSTSNEFKVRFRNHKSNMLKNKRTCELAIHFNNSEHEISQINFIVIEQIRSFENSLHLEQLLLTREAYWTAQLFTLNPHGLNKRREFRSKHRINYYN